MINETAWLIHSRSYTDSRILVDVLCEQSGLIGGVYRLGKKTVRPRLFQKMEVQWQGKNELKNIRSLEPVVGTQLSLSGRASWCGMYVNELLSKLLQREDAHPEIFEAYETVLEDLQSNMEVSLRKFELLLLNALGYGLDFTHDYEGEEIRTDRRYTFEPESGFQSLTSSSREQMVFTGSSLLAIAGLDFSAQEAKVSAKQLTRICIDQLLGGKVLKSRELFRTK